MSKLLIPPLGVAVDHSGWERSEAGFGNAQDNPAGHDFRFQLESRGEHGTKLRSWQEYAVELDDDYYDNYNFNGAITWRACGSTATWVQASLTQRPIEAAGKDRLRELGATRPGTI